MVYSVAIAVIIFWKVNVICYRLQLVSCLQPASIPEHERRLHWFGSDVLQGDTVEVVLPATRCVICCDTAALSRSSLRTRQGGVQGSGNYDAFLHQVRSAVERIMYWIVVASFPVVLSGSVNWWVWSDR